MKRKMQYRTLWAIAQKLFVPQTLMVINFPCPPINPSRVHKFESVIPDKKMIPRTNIIQQPNITIKIRNIQSRITNPIRGSLRQIKRSIQKIWRKDQIQIHLNQPFFWRNVTQRKSIGTSSRKRFDNKFDSFAESEQPLSKVDFCLSDSIIL